MQISFTTICLFLFLSLPFYSHSQNQRDTSGQQAFTLADFLPVPSAARAKGR
jgi:hypothetical protein